MQKKLISFWLLLAVIISQFASVFASEKKQMLEMNTLFECDFDSEFLTTKGEFSAGGAITVQEGNRKFLRADSRSGAKIFYVYPEKWQECDSALVSFDVRTDSTTCRSYMDVFNAKDFTKGLLGL